MTTREQHAQPGKWAGLPPGFSYEKRQVAQGWSYVFRHFQLGELGRLLVQEAGGEATQFSLEVVGDPSDPMTARRKA